MKKKIVKSVVLYASETWTVTQTEHDVGAGSVSKWVSV